MTAETEFSHARVRAPDYAGAIDNRLPDIQSGHVDIRSHLHRGLAEPNRWTTRIQSALRKDGNTAFLAYECRHEAISDTSIFPAAPEERLVINGFGENYVMHSGAASRHPFRKTRVHLKHLPPGRVEVSTSAPERAVELLSPNAAREQLRAGKWPETFMRVTSPEGEILCPVNYINFSDAYLQPITGYVLWHDGEYRVGYVAAHLSDGRAHCELILRRPVSALSIKAMGRAFSWLKWLPVHFLCQTDEFTETVTLDADVTLFRYA